MFFKQIKQLSNEKEELLKEKNLLKEKLEVFSVNGNVLFVYLLCISASTYI